MIHLETERLLLRDWSASDLEPFTALNADAQVMEFYPAIMSRDDSYALAMAFQQSLDEDGYGFYAVETKATKAFIGYVGLSPVRFTAPFTPAVEIAWKLARAAWGYGYASEAAAACLAHGFGELGLAEIVAFTTPANERSIAVMERLGMSRDPAGDFNQPNLPAGHALRPHVLYRLTSQKYRANR